MTRTRCAVLVALVLALSAPAAGLAQYGSGALTLSVTSATTGQGFTATGSGYAPSSNVSLVFTSDPVALGTVTANASGAFTASVTVPADATVGQHTVTASGLAPDNSARILTAPITVVAKPAAAGPLVRTGSSGVGSLILWGALLIAVGFVAVVAVRRNYFRRQRVS